MGPKGNILPYSNKLGDFSGSAALAFHLEGIDMVDGEYGSRDEDRQSHNSVQDYQTGEDHQVQMVATAFLEFILLSVDDYGSDLLVHEDQDTGNESRDQSNRRSPVGITVKWRNKPAAALPCWLKWGTVYCQNKVFSLWDPKNLKTRQMSPFLDIFGCWPGKIVYI